MMVKHDRPQSVPRYYVMKCGFDFPALSSYQGQTFDFRKLMGQIFLGADDKSGIAEIMTAMAYLAAHPEIEHGKYELPLPR